MSCEQDKYVSNDNIAVVSCLDNCLYVRAQRMMGNERPCDMGILLDSAILAYTWLKVEFS